MARLEELVVGRSVLGIASNGLVSIIATKWYDENILEVTFKDGLGQLGSQLLNRYNEESLNVGAGIQPYSFDADANKLKLALEAYRINLAHVFDPYIAVRNSAIDPLPHQISAVYQEMLPRLPLRYILADDPGAGKTIMTGLFLKEMLIRGDLKRCLIVSPGNLAEQWIDELHRKFNLPFKIITNDLIQSSLTGNIFNELNFCVARLDKLSRNETLQAKLRVTDWDVIVCDEAHKMSATIWGSEVKHTKRFQLGQLLSSITRHFLLLTATPHNGKEKDFQLFMSLIDSERFEGAARCGDKAVDVSDVMRRLVKEDLLKFDGKPLFTERIAYTVNYSLSPLEAKLYADVTNYIGEEFNRADKLNADRKITVGFALTILQRRLASSPEAIYQSLKRRHERLETRLNEERLGKRDVGTIGFRYEDYEDEDDMPAVEIEDTEELVVDQASAAQTIAEMEGEIETLKKLEFMANEVRISGEDRKWEELSKLLQDNDNMLGDDGRREKLIIFTEHRDTLKYLEDKIITLLGNTEEVVTIHGGMQRDERRKVEELFKQDKETRILVATDAAGEGINLQRAHLMVNYDLPWNPNRLEQRFGRIHRIGQTEVCHLWNLVSAETREGMVFHRLFEKLELEREALKGKVFNVLGKVTFENKPLRDLLIEAIRYGNDPSVRDRVNQVVDHSVNAVELNKLIEEHVLAEDTMDMSRVMAIREDMERREARKLQPYFIESFFIEAFRSVGGKIYPREKGRYEITLVPLPIRNYDTIKGFGEHILSRYERICFDKSNISNDIIFTKEGDKRRHSLIPATLISPDHALMEATLAYVLESNMDTLKRGAVFLDEADLGVEPRLLFYIEDSVQDGVILPNGNRRVISKHIHFIEITKEGEGANAGFAPHLDYRAVDESDLVIVKQYLKSQIWLQESVEEKAINYAIRKIIPSHFKNIKERKDKLINKTIKAVEKRMDAEIRYWYFRYSELKEKEAMGIINAKQNSMMADKRAGDLEVRKLKRIETLNQEKNISSMPPLVVGSAIVIPRGLLNNLLDRQEIFTDDAISRKEIELTAMKTVIDVELSLGYKPLDVSVEKRGYDVESTIPVELRGANGSILRLIEVKGRAKGAETVTVSKNEIITALNIPEDFILAIVIIDGASIKTTYLKLPFRENPDFAATSVNYNIDELIGGAEVILRR